MKTDWIVENEGTDDEPKTLRDEFAMAALQGNLANPSLTFSSWECLAEMSYEAADAMLKERFKSTLAHQFIVKKKHNRV